VPGGEADIRILRASGDPSMRSDDEAATRLPFPVVTIGLAVYNGERYLREALDSLVSQTLRNVEIVICDNASEDATESICREYAARDSRIRYYRNPTNIGGARNENLTCQLATGKYFHFAAHDDVCDPRLLEEGVRVLETRPEAVLMYPGIKRIDECGDLIEASIDSRGTELTPSKRLRSLYRTTKGCEIIYGVVRTDALRRSDLQLNYTDSDRSLLCQLAMFGEFVVVPEYLFSKRVHPEMSVLKFPDWRARMAWFGDDVASGPSLPNWQQLRHLFSIVRRAPLTPAERFRCSIAMVGWVGIERRWRRLLKDLYVASKTLAQQRKNTP